MMTQKVRLLLRVAVQVLMLEHRLSIQRDHTGTTVPAVVLARHMVASCPLVAVAVAAFLGC